MSQTPWTMDRGRWTRFVSGKVVGPVAQFLQIAYEHLGYVDGDDSFAQNGFFCLAEKTLHTSTSLQNHLNSIGGTWEE